MERKSILLAAAFVLLFSSSLTSRANDGQELVSQPFEAGIRYLPRARQVAGFEAEITNKSPVNDFYNKYAYYRVDDVPGRPVVADVLEPSAFEENVLEIKLITAPGEYYFSGYPDLQKEEYVCEFVLQRSEGGLAVSFYIPSLAEKDAILGRAFERCEDPKTQGRLITSLNAEYNYKSSLPSAGPLRSARSAYGSRSKEGDGNNQQLLENYLLTGDTRVDPITAGTPGSGNKIYPTDDPIVNLIPKDYFATEGMRHGQGIEWGYFINTFANDMKTNVCSVLLYDIAVIKTNFIDPEDITIKPVLSYNYLYRADLDVVSKNSPNSYCLANPKFTAALVYDNNPDNLIGEPHKNYGESEYDFRKDDGFCFGSSTATFIGVSKNYKDGVDGIAGLVEKYGGIVMKNIITSAGSWQKFAIGAAKDTVSAVGMSLLKYVESSMTRARDQERYVYTTAKISGYGDFDDAKRDAESKKVIRCQRPFP